MTITSQSVKLAGCGFLFFGIIVCVVALWIHFSPTRYQASARVNISFEISTLIPPKPGQFYFDGDSYEASLIPGEAKIFKSNAVLQKTVENLGLCSEWKTTTNGAVRKLRRCVSSQMTFDCRIEITATDTNDERAQKIINGLVDAYCQFRSEQWQQTQQSRIEERKKELPRFENNAKTAQEKFDEIKNKLNLTNDAPLSWLNFQTSNPAYFEAGNKLWLAKAQYDAVKSETQFPFIKFARIEEPVRITEFKFPEGLDLFLAKFGMFILLLGGLIILFSRRKFLRVK